MSGVRQVGMRLLIVMAATLVLLAGCDYGDDDHDDDDFIVSFSSESEIEIYRASGRPFDVLEIGVTPFFDPIFGDRPYIFSISGISWVDGDEFIFELQDDVRRPIRDPLLGEPLEDVIMRCGCFIDYVILRSEFGRRTLFFD